MSSIINSKKSRIARDTLTIDPELHPGWITATERTPIVGEKVLCAEGLAELARVLGKTGDGSRLLELVLPDRPRHPFFAAASNVLITQQVSA